MKYLERKHLIYLNQNILKQKTPEEISGVRESGALDMLVQAPKEKLYGRELYPTVYDKAAILLINIATKHVFHNGNKRTAFVSTEIFMELNGYQSNFTFDEAIHLILWIVNEHEKHKKFEDFKKIVAEELKSKYFKK